MRLDEGPSKRPFSADAGTGAFGAFPGMMGGNMSMAGEGCDGSVLHWVG